MLRWHHEHGAEVVPALRYIEQLESELLQLRLQVRRACAGVGNVREVRGWG